MRSLRDYCKVRQFLKDKTGLNDAIALFPKGVFGKFGVFK